MRNGRTSQAMIRKKAEKIKLLLSDVDGVLTDTGVYYSDAGEAMKRFSIRDGMGVALLRELAFVETGIITGELSGSIRKRAEKLQITELHLGIKEKTATLLEILGAKGLSSEEVAFIGDDVNDIGIINSVGLSACPNDAYPSVKYEADLVCRAKGGHGAFREFAEIIISARVNNRKASPEK